MKNIKLKPFCVKSSELTNQELNTMLERLVGLGITICDWIEGFDKWDSHLYAKDTVTYWGVDVDFDTYASNKADHYEDNILSKEEAFKLLGIEIEKTVITEHKLKPFCVKSSELTNQELNTMLEKCVELGAAECEWVSGFDKPVNNLTSYNRTDFNYWGVDMCLLTFTTGDSSYFEDNILSKEEAFEMLGIDIKGSDHTEGKLRPFCVKSSDLTGQELNTMLEKCEALGAYLRDWVKGYGDKPTEYFHDKDRYPYWGIDDDFDTFTSYNEHHYEGNILTKEEAFEMLGIETQDSSVEEVPVYTPECVEDDSQGFKIELDVTYSSEVKTLSEAIHAHSGEVLITKEGKVVVTTEELGEITLESTDAFIKFVNMFDKLYYTPSKR